MHYVPACDYGTASDASFILLSYNPMSDVHVAGSGKHSASTAVYSMKMVEGPIKDCHRDVARDVHLLGLGALMSSISAHGCEHSTIIGPRIHTWFVADDHVR